MMLSGDKKDISQILIYFAFLVKVYCFFLTRAWGVKFLYFYADVICEWSLSNKNEIQFTLDDWNLEGDKGDHYIMLHKSSYCTK